jgi:hypothetical protein
MSTERKAPLFPAAPRRQFFGHMLSGLAGVGLTHLLGNESLTSMATALPVNGMPHSPPKAKRVLQIFCPGAASHIDLWEHKPLLEKYHGKPLPGEEEFLSFQGKNGNLMRSPWDFSPAGQSGKLMSSLLPHMAQHVDDIAFLHGMHSKSNTHGPGCIFMNTSFTEEGYPAAGAWISHALGSLNENLPAYVALTDVRGEPPNGKANWGSGFLPAQHQGIPMNAQTPIRNLALPAGVTPDQESATRGFLEQLNQRHAQRFPENTELQARIAAYQLAARMQLSAPEVSALDREPKHIHQRYGTGDENHLKAAYARNCLLARRLLERGVRCVNLYCASRASGVDGLLNWDAHKTLRPDYERHGPVFDQPTAALLSDLKQRGMLEDTLVLWATEFGRMPTHQAGTAGRDHNPDGFTTWMMGAGIRGGTSYGATDEFGRRAEQNPTSVYNYYATVLHLLGLDHQRLSHYHNGIDRRLTDVHGKVITPILA